MGKESETHRVIQDFQIARRFLDTSAVLHIGPEHIIVHFAVLAALQVNLIRASPEQNQTALMRQTQGSSTKRPVSTGCEKLSKPTTSHKKRDLIFLFLFLSLFPPSHAKLGHFGVSVRIG
jgi:hypothetical protein